MAGFGWNPFVNPNTPGFTQEGVPYVQFNAGCPPAGTPNGGGAAGAGAAGAARNPGPYLPTGANLGEDIRNLIGVLGTSMSNTNAQIGNLAATMAASATNNSG